MRKLAKAMALVAIAILVGVTVAYATIAHYDDVLIKDDDPTSVTVGDQGLYEGTLKLRGGGDDGGFIDMYVGANKDDDTDFYRVGVPRGSDDYALQPASGSLGNSIAILVDGGTRDVTISSDTATTEGGEILLDADGDVVISLGS